MARKFKCFFTVAELDCKSVEFNIRCPSGAFFSGHGHFFAQQDANDNISVSINYMETTDSGKRLCEIVLTEREAAKILKYATGPYAFSLTSG